VARLLVVDDEPRFRDYLTRILASDGHEVRAAADEAGALASVEAFEPDLLIADWMLRSGVDGLELACGLRRRFPDLATIVITGHPAEAVRRRVASGEVAALLEKPFRTEALRDAVQRALR
jgi:CheY-like chemotaxis protein